MPERRPESPAERVLISGREVGPRLQHRKCEPARKANLRHFVDENAVGGQRRSDGVAGTRPGAPVSRDARRARRDAPRAPAIAQARGPLCAGIRRSRAAHPSAASATTAAAALRKRFGSSGSMSTRTTLQRVVDSPLALLKEQPRADAEHDVRVGPQPMGDRQADVQPVRRRHDALAPPVGHDRRLEHFRQRDDLGARILRPAARRR